MIGKLLCWATIRLGGRHVESRRKQPDGTHAFVCVRCGRVRFPVKRKRDQMPAVV